MEVTVFHVSERRLQVGYHKLYLSNLALSQSLQEEPTSSYSQLTELMMSSRTTLTSALPRDLPNDALISNGSFLINLEGESQLS